MDSLYDRFLLDARLDSLDLLSLNEIVKPLAPAEVVSGWAQDVVFHMDASSRKGRIRLDFPYRKLKVALLKEKDGETTQKGFLSRLANLVLRDNNPAHPERKIVNCVRSIWKLCEIPIIPRLTIYGRC